MYSLQELDTFLPAEVSSFGRGSAPHAWDKGQTKSGGGGLTEIEALAQASHRFKLKLRQADKALSIPSASRYL